jgi:hypothetical protein
MARSKKSMLGKRSPPSKAEIRQALEIIALGSHRGAQGGSILSFLKGVPGRIKDAVMGGPRMDFSPSVRRFLAEYGNAPVTSLVVFRAPVQSFLNQALETLSQGRWLDAMKNAKYDSMMHLGLVAEIRDSKGSTRRVILEKNEVWNIGTSFKSQKDAEYLPVQLGVKPITINTLVEGARKEVGDKAFFEYNAFSTNCQHGALSLLKGSGLLTADAEKWIFQPVDQILNELPGYVKHVAKALTDVAATADVVLHGRGARPAARRRRAK